LMTRQAISPRLAISIFVNMVWRPAFGVERSAWRGETSLWRRC
jgi:hypothetical protein